MKRAFSLRMLFLLAAIIALSTMLNRIPIHRTVSKTWYFDNGGELRFEKVSHGWPVDIGVPSRASAVAEIGKTATGSPILNWNFYTRYPDPASIICNSIVAAAIVIAAYVAVLMVVKQVNKMLDRSGDSRVS